MRWFRLGGAVLAVAFVSGGVASAPASAVSFVLAYWLANGSSVTSELLTETAGELLLEDSKALGGKASVLCSGIFDGWIGPNSLGWISELLTLAGVAVSTTVLSGTGLECAAQSGCEAGTKPKVWASGLGWETEAELMEQGAEFFFANLILPHAGGSNPGWEMECNVLGLKIVDDCSAAESVAELKLEGVTLLEKFSKAFSELTAAKLANCSLGGTESGAIEGEDSLILKEGGELSLSSEGVETTSLSTVLSGEGKEGETLTVLEGSKVKDKATLKGKNASTATGKVIYKVYSDSECKTFVTTAGEVTVGGESVPASSEEELEGGKTYYWQAHYTGDSKNAESTSECTEVLNIKAKTTISTKLSGEAEEAEELVIAEGSKAKDTAALSGTNSSTATGKVIYKVYSDKECKTLVKEAGEVTLESSAKVPVSTEEELEGGKTYYWQATYKGDGLHQESKSTCGSEIETVLAPTKHYYLAGEAEIGPLEKVTIEGTSGSSQISTTLVGTKVIVECSQNTYSGDLESAGSSDATVEYKECKVLNEAETDITACKVSEPIVSKLKGSLIGHEEHEAAEPTELKFSPAEGTEFATLELTSTGTETCAESGKYSITGSQVCRLSDGEEYSAIHDLECTPGGSKLTLGSSTANLLSTEDLKLANGEVFAAVQQPRILSRWMRNGNALPQGEPQNLSAVGVVGYLRIEGTTKAIRFMFECNTVEAPTAYIMNIFVVGSPVLGAMLGPYRFRGCNERTVTPANCTITEPITTTTLAGYIGEGVEASRGRIVIAFWVDDASERRVFPITFTGAACSLNNVTINVVRGSGRAGALASISSTELETQKLSFEPNERYNYKERSGAISGAGLRVEGEETYKVFLTGEVTADLAAGGRWAPG
jgi:hypothetical protein